MRSTLYHKMGQVAVEVARDLLNLRPGDRIGRVQDYAQRCGTGMGTVQKALRSLVEAGAVKLEARGHLGTYLVEVDYGRLREVAGLHSLLGLMPLPYTKRYEGLATGLYEAHRPRGLPLNLGYMRGAKQRLRALVQGQCDFVVLSQLAAEEALAQWPVKRVMGLGPATYVGGHGVLVADPSQKGVADGMRVGIDPQTLDQQALTAEECQGKAVTLVPVAYSQLLDRLRQGDLDAAIWNLDEVTASGGLGIAELQSEGARRLAARSSEAVLVIRNDRPDLERLLPQLFEPARVVAVQQEVLAGIRIPSY